MSDQEKASEREVLRELSAPGAKDVATEVDSGEGRGLAYLAGLCGAWFFTPLLWMPIPLILSIRRGLMGPEDIVYYLIHAAVSALALAPFGIALVWARRELRKRAMIAAAHGVIVGSLLCILFFSGGFLFILIGFIVWLAPGVLGPVFGLVALAFCWRRGDAQGRALALLGIAPAMFLALLSVGIGIAKINEPRDVDAMKAAPARSQPRPTSPLPTR